MQYMELKSVNLSEFNFDELSSVYGSQYDLCIGISFLVLTIVGSIGNCLTLLVIGKTKRLYNHCTPFIFSLAIGNLLCCMTSLPVVAHNALVGKHVFTLFTCKVLSMELHALFGVSFATLAAISFIRAIVVWTNGTSKWLNNYLITFLLMTTWLVPIVAVLPLFFVFGSASHSGRICSYFCGLNNMQEVKSEAEKGSNIVIILTATYVGFPVVVMGICYSLIFYQIRSSRINLEEFGVVAFNMQKREQNFSKMLTFIFLSYVVCTFPAAICHLNDRTDFFFPSSSVPDWMYVLFFVLVMTPFATNSLIYVLSDPNYRRAYMDTLSCNNYVPSPEKKIIWRSLSFRSRSRENSRVVENPFS